MAEIIYMSFRTIRGGSRGTGELESHDTLFSSVILTLMPTCAGLGSHIYQFCWVLISAVFLPSCFLFVRYITSAISVLSLFLIIRNLLNWRLTNCYKIAPEVCMPSSTDIESALIPYTEENNHFDCGCRPYRAPHCPPTRPSKHPNHRPRNHHTLLPTRRAMVYMPVIIPVLRKLGILSKVIDHSFLNHEGRVWRDMEGKELAQLKVAGTGEGEIGGVLPIGQRRINELILGELKKYPSVEVKFAQKVVGARTILQKTP